jgi:hypothetical protein
MDNEDIKKLLNKGDDKSDDSKKKKWKLYRLYLDQIKYIM